MTFSFFSIRIHLIERSHFDFFVPKYHRFGTINNKFGKIFSNSNISVKITMVNRKCKWMPIRFGEFWVRETLCKWSIHVVKLSRSRLTRCDVM